VRAALVERFGPGVIVDGEVDRAAIGEIVFDDRDELVWLEQLLHPRVAREYLEWRERLAELPEPPAVAATEVPLLYEVGAEERFDAVVLVTAPEKLRIARSDVPVEQRSPRLIPDEEKAKRADFVYRNAGSLEDLDRFVASVVENLGEWG
jgi:dephospho-CoA kinase